MPSSEPKITPPDFRLAASRAEAKLLTKQHYLVVLRQLTHEASSVSELARAIGESPETTAYRVKQLLRANIVVQMGTASKPKRYAAHPYWQIPNELLDALSLEEFMMSFFEGSMRAVFAAFARHLRVSSQPWVLQLNFRAAQFIDFLPETAHHEWLPVLEHLILYLKPADAVMLQAELRALSEKYRQRHDAAQGQAHLVGLMFTKAN
jgi:DNA-binding Lrp family transcriptional regulator